jgi:hypothetical protein
MLALKHVSIKEHFNYSMQLRQKEGESCKGCQQWIGKIDELSGKYFTSLSSLKKELEYLRKETKQ